MFYESKRVYNTVFPWKYLIFNLYTLHTRKVLTHTLYIRYVYNYKTFCSVKHVIKIGFETFYCSKNKFKRNGCNAYFYLYCIMLYFLLRWKSLRLERRIKVVYAKTRDVLNTARGTGRMNLL